MKRTLLIAPLAALVLLGAGCRSNTTNTGANPGAAPERAASSGSSATSSACAHPYYPLRNGYFITYNNRYTGGASSYTMAISDVTANSAKLTVTYQNGIRSEQIYNCNNGAIQAAGYVDLAAGMTGASATTQTRSVEGELLPRDLRVGSRWNTKFTINMNMGGALPPGSGMGDSLTGSVSIDREAVAEESVTVPAGTFRAIKVKSLTDFRIDQATGAPQESFPPITSYEWWVEGKGMVKTTLGSDQSIVSEATQIVVP